MSRYLRDAVMLAAGGILAATAAHSLTAVTHHKTVVIEWRHGNTVGHCHAVTIAPAGQNTDYVASGCKP